MTNFFYILVVIVAIQGLIDSWHISKLRDRIVTLENEKKERVRLLTDPEVIDMELERSARRREAFDSKMPYPPRDDAGPPAVVKEAKVTTWSKSASRFDRPSRYQGEERPIRFQPKKD